MSKVSNNIMVRNNGIFSHISSHNFFSSEDIKNIIAECSIKNLQTASIINNGPEVDTNTRIAKVSFHNPTEYNSWIFNKINSAIDSINNQFFNFDLYGFNAFQYSEYHGEELGKYDFHLDLVVNDESCKNHLTRKLSLVILLSEPGVDFEGGEFQINLSSEKNVKTLGMKKGSLIAFPSFFIHRVTPVTKGIRRSIAVWVEGPKFK